MGRQPLCRQAAAAWLGKWAGMRLGRPSMRAAAQLCRQAEFGAGQIGQGGSGGQATGQPQAGQQQPSAAGNGMALQKDKIAITTNLKFLLMKRAMMAKELSYTSCADRHGRIWCRTDWAGRQRVGRAGHWPAAGRPAAASRALPATVNPHASLQKDKTAITTNPEVLLLMKRAMMAKELSYTNCLLSYIRS